YLGERELRLQDGDVIPVPGSPVSPGKRVRQDRQPLAQQRAGLRRAQGVADRLQGGHVIDGGEGVVQRGEADPGPGGLPLGPLVAVEAQLGVERKVAAELQEERAEAVTGAVEVELVHHTGLQRDPRVGRAVAAAALAGPEQRDLLLRPAGEQHAIGPGEPGQELLGHVVLALAPGEVDPGDLPAGGDGPPRTGRGPFTQPQPPDMARWAGAKPRWSVSRGSWYRIS